MLKVRCVTVLLWAASLAAQDPFGFVEGEIRDPSGSLLPGAVVTAVHLETGYRQSQPSSSTGFYRIALPIGLYSIHAGKTGFAEYRREPVRLTVSQTVRLDIGLTLAAREETITITHDAELVDTATNTLGKVVSSREVLDLPLNGRNFTQLGLLQAGVAPPTAGLLQAGGSLRTGQSYSVNGQRPESNNFRVDGARNVNRMDGGFALRIPVDAIEEFRILTHTPPPEYGGASGSNTSVVTKAGTNSFHGSIYHFLRNDRLDARNFFSADVEPLKQNQFGATLGGPVQKERLFFFGYYEGFRNRQGVTRSGIVPTAAQRTGDFSNRPAPLLDLAAGGVPVPGGRIAPSLFNPVAVGLMERYYPLGNTSPSVYTATVVTRNDYDQGGGRVDYFRGHDRVSARYSYSDGANVNPISIRGSDLPGFPVGDELTTHSVTASETHLFSPATMGTFRGSFLRHRFHFDQRLNRTTPRDLGFNYDSASEAGQGPPFFNVNGYSAIGGAITGPRNSAQNDYEASAAVSHLMGSHSLKAGGELRRTTIDAFQAIAPNAFFVFTPSFPTSDGFANFLQGRPLVFYQGLGDLSRGLSTWENSLFVQDEWRATPRLTVNLGARWEVNTPVTEQRDRLNTFVPGQQSTVFPGAPRGVLFPGDEGVAKGLAPVFYNAWMPRAGLAWNPDGRGVTSIRAAFGIFFDTMSNGAGLAFQAPVSSLPWTQLYQFSGPGTTFVDPYGSRPRPAPETFLRPATVVGTSKDARPPYASNWNLSLQRAFLGNHVVEARYVGSKGTHLPRNVEANPAVWGPGATAQNADRRRLYANCPADPATPCQLVHTALMSTITNSTYHAGQLSFSRRFASGVSWNASYWFSKTIDYLSAMNLTGAAARPLSGEVDIAQNPFNLRAERGASLFDARHRLVLSGSWEIKALGGLQLNAIASVASGTPFTVFDSTNVSGQGSHPPVSGFFGSRPDAIADPNTGPKTPEAWLPRSAFRRLNPVTEAGNFGNAGRNIARADGFSNVDVSLLKSFRLNDGLRLQLRAECFNVVNHANFGVPVSDLASGSFGRVLDSGPSRLFQAGLKLLF